MHQCAGPCGEWLPRDAFGTQAVKVDCRPGRKPRINVRNSRCIKCDSSAARKGERMASPAEIVRNWDRREGKAPANSNEREPDGYIRVNGKPCPVWLPEGVTPESIGLKTFRRERRIIAA